MNRLPTTKRAEILNLLIEGMSMRAASRVADVSINTVYKLMIDAGKACAAYHDETVRDVHASRIQADELWSFCYAKEKNVADAKSPPPGAGDVWTWTAIDCDSKLIVSWWVGDRSGATAAAFMKDLRSRLAGHVHLTTDRYTPYPEAVEAAFGDDVDYEQLVKAPGERRASTSYVERSNLTIRMGNRRYTRRTNAFSKRMANHCHMLALYFWFYNWSRGHMSLHGATPAMAAGLAKTFMEFEDLIAMLDRK